MIISDSAIQLFSERTSVEMHEKRESLTVWKGEEEPRVSRANSGRGRELHGAVEQAHPRKDKVSIGHHMKSRQVSRAEMEVVEEARTHVELNMRVLQAMFERITGRKFQMTEPVTATQGGSASVVAASSQGADAGASVEESEGYGMVYDYHESHYEYEKTEFQSEGIIKTEDGRTIDFNVSLSMSREFYSEQSVNIRAGDALKDPLVVNFSGSAAEVSQRDFHFDIDADGQSDQIGFVGPGSGFLAVDKNNDGTINDGSELFGALSGDGFADLAEYDLDGNNWIDEKDDIYDSLRIWARDQLGQEQLMGLGQAGVGAIYLGHVETMFSVKDSDNAMLGQVKETGIAVMETGQVVTMQQVDLVA